jgi:hypothetical protein
VNKIKGLAGRVRELLRGGGNRSLHITVLTKDSSLNCKKRLKFTNTDYTIGYKVKEIGMSLSSSERFGFIGELRIYTYRNLFPNDVPKGSALFNDMLLQHNSAKTFERAISPASLKIADFQIGNDGFAEILLRLVDPRIPDNVLSDRKSGALRVATRKTTEDPAVSAHLVINLNSKFDAKRHYPMCIENVDFLPRGMAITFLNDWMLAAFSKKRIRNGEKEERVFRPRFEFVAPASQTLSDILENGGALAGVSWIEDKYTENTFGDSAFPIERRNTVAINIKNRPKKTIAKEILQKILSGDKQGREKVKVTIRDENDFSKTVPIDPMKANVLSNIFIHQERYEDFAMPMAMCEAKVRSDLTSQMKKSIST